MKITPIIYNNQNFTSLFKKKNKDYTYSLKPTFPFVQKEYFPSYTPCGLYSKGEIQTSPDTTSAFKKQVENYKQTKQKIPKDTYFIRMESYEKDNDWAKNMEELTYLTSYLISQKMPFKQLMAIIEKEIKKINGSCAYFGTKRIQNNTFQLCEIGRGSEYYDLYIYEMNDHSKRTIEPKPTKEFKDANTTSIKWNNKCRCVEIIYGKMDENSSNLEHIKNLYQILIKTENPSENQINKIAGAIHWLFAQQTPYERGSDSIANLLTKSIYHCYDMDISPIKEYHSLDFEAFHTDAENFIEHYPDYFENKPKKLI